MPIILLLLLLLPFSASAGTVLGTGDYCFEIELVPQGLYEQLPTDLQRLAYRRASAEMDGGLPTMQELSMSEVRVMGTIGLAARPYEGKDCPKRFHFAAAN
jgi:hypothetical protein